MNRKKRILLSKYLTHPKSLLLFFFSRYITHLIHEDAKYIKICFWLYFGKSINLRNPRTFQEKLQWLKLHNRRPEFTQMVDKYEAKKYVASIIGEEYIIPTLGVWDNADEIDFSRLPERFVLKCTHDSGRVIICKDKSRFNCRWACKRLNDTLRTDYFKRSREFPYKNVRRRVIAEKYMEDEHGEDLTDYKFFCFNGVAQFCQVIGGRSKRETIDFFDRQWVHQDFVGLTPRVGFSPTPWPKPDVFPEMLRIADTLATKIDSPFVRIDLYVINGHVYFGENTFFPNSGFGKFQPEAWNLKMGEMIDLTKKI